MGIFAGIVLLSILMIVHELGHFLTGLKLGFRILEFSLFMGPVLYSREHNGRLRKYYSITELGRQELDSFVGDAESIQEIIAYVKRGAGK